MIRSLPELWILRHGQTEWNVEERLQGHLDSPLTGLGERQAQAQREILRRSLPRGGVRALSSPSGRAWRTAEIALEGLGLSLEADPALREVDIGAWQGRKAADLRSEHPRISACSDPHAWKFTAPGGESLEQMVCRLTALLDRLDGPAVLITHGVTSRVLRCLALGRPAGEMSDLPGGQGVIHHVKDGMARLLEP